VKIADFGLARELHKDENDIKLDKNQRLPIKWLAPETIMEKVCSKKTDVSSYIELYE
jgi:serine/threonine protein kinase